MAYNEELSQRVRSFLKPFENEIEEKKMFGGLAFMYQGKMSVGINGDRLMCRCRLQNYESFLEKPFVSEMDFTGKALKGFLYVEPEGFESDEELQFWIDEAVAFVVEGFKTA